MAESRTTRSPGRPACCAPSAIPEASWPMAMRMSALTAARPTRRVVVRGFVAKFEHVAEDGDAAAFDRQQGEGVEGGEHGGGVGVVGVVEEGGSGGGAAESHTVWGG